jgi:hypothetical protein
VSESSPSTPSPYAHTAEAEVTDGEGERRSDALPVLAGAARVTPAQAGVPTALPAHRRPVIPAVQAAAVAAGGFVAGAAVVGLVHHRQRRAGALVKGRRAGRRPAHVSGRGAGKTAELVQIVSSRSLLVDVHLLGGADER